MNDPHFHKCMAAITKLEEQHYGIISTECL